MRARGGTIHEGTRVTGITDETKGVRLAVRGGGDERFDRVVVATGTWLDHLARPFGVRMHVQAGRGYSFSVPIDHTPQGPVYLPAQRVACTPLGDRLRVTGMMEFRKPEAALDPRRITAIVDAARPYLTGVDLDDRQDEWVGSRPCTSDGLPLIGVTATGVAFLALYVVYLPLVWWLGRRRIGFRWTRAVRWQATLVIVAAVAVELAARVSDIVGAAVGLALGSGLAVWALLRLSAASDMTGRLAPLARMGERIRKWITAR